MPVRFPGFGQINPLLFKYDCIDVDELPVDQTGDGMIDLPAIRAMAEAGGYRGAVESELLPHRWWKKDPDDALRMMKDRHATVC